MSTEQGTPNFSELLASAVMQPGTIAQCYSAFWNYSLMNQLAALQQCESRGITPGPIATFMDWKDKARYVKKGQKAIVLCMPVTGKRSAMIHNDETGQDETAEIGYTRFVWRANWFVLAQTEGADFVPAVPGFDFPAALAALNIERAEFAHTDGNCQGYATKRTVAVSPIAAHPERTLLHEMAHVVLGHTAEAELNDMGEGTPKDIRELEAEATAMLCCAGPVKLPKLYNGTNKTFFFFSYEEYLENGTINSTSATVPLPAYRNGDFSQLIPLSGNQPSRSVARTLWIRWAAPSSPVRYSTRIRPRR